MAYRQVDILSRSGYPAYALHLKENFRYTWFENSTPLAYLPSIDLKADDVLVVPETCGDSVIRELPVPRKVIFNQNAYYTFLAGSDLRQTAEAILCVSEDNRRYLQYAFPQQRIIRLHLSVDPKVFYPGEKKIRQIAFMPRKHSQHSDQVLGILKQRGALNHYQVAAIDACSEKEVARQLRESNIFLSFGFPEGFPLPPAEAMCSGALVIGYHGGGGTEYFRPEFSYPIPINDIIAFAEATELAIATWDTNPEIIQAKTRAAAEFMATEYSPEREKNDVLAAWSEIY